MDKWGHHGLLCLTSAGRIPRGLNDILKRNFCSVNIPCTIEPRGLLREDGKRPDRVTLIPWKPGRTLE
jgi:hypothetical protein